MPELVRIGGSGRGVGWAFAIEALKGSDGVALSGGTLKGSDWALAGGTLKGSDWALAGGTLKGSDWALAVGNSNAVGGNGEFDART